MDPVVAVEIGTTKTLVLVGERKEDGRVLITGMGMAESAGVRKGEVLDIDSANLSVSSAIKQAEETSSVDIGTVHVAVSGGHIESFPNRGKLSLAGGGEITPEDVEQVTEIAQAVSLAPDREIIHTIRQSFTIDESHRVERPEGMHGAQLALDILVVHGVRNRLMAPVKPLKQLGIEVLDVVFGGLASAMAVLTPEQKSSGVILIDLGGGTADCVVYVDGYVASAGSLAVGGDHVTRDIVIAFKTSIAQAERLKRDSGCVRPGRGAPQRLTVTSDTGMPERTVDAVSLSAVIEVRVEEMFRVLRSKFVPDALLRRVGAGVILTGGGARLGGMDVVAGRVFELPCAVARPREVDGIAAADAPECSACLGLIEHGFRDTGSGPRSSAWKKIFGSLFTR
ncbi:MAG: cell division protein FtsA [Lentisphaerae bacterium]|nr:cell division protein FtsA [Lentisphaerota bacterium]